MDTRDEVVDEQFREVKKKADADRKLHEEDRGRIAELEKMLAIKSKPTYTPGDRALESFDRQRDLRVLRVNSAEPVRKDAALSTLKDWLADANIGEEEYAFSGPGLGKFFSITFLAEGAGLAAERCDAAFKELREEINGKWVWKNFEAETPSAKKVRLLVSEDKSPKQAKEEMSSKRLWKVIQAVHPDKEVVWTGKDNAVSVDCVPVATVVAKNKKDAAQILWKYNGVHSQKIQKEEIIKKYERSFNASFASVQWEL